MALDSVISLICNHVFQIPFPAGSRWDGGGEAEPSGVQYQGYCWHPLSWKCWLILIPRHLLLQLLLVLDKIIWKNAHFLKSQKIKAVWKQLIEMMDRDKSFRRWEWKKTNHLQRGKVRLASKMWLQKPLNAETQHWLLCNYSKVDFRINRLVRLSHECEKNRQSFSHLKSENPVPMTCSWKRTTLMTKSSELKEDFKKRTQAR